MTVSGREPCTKGNRLQTTAERVRTLTCIICPNGCEIRAENKAGEKEAADWRFEGALCPRGEKYALQEMTDPRRTIATSAAVRGGEEPLVSLRLTEPIPLGCVREAAEEIHRYTLIAPIHAGDVVIRNLLGLGSDVIATRTVKAAVKAVQACTVREEMS
ncbi:MAG: DUF1667 domain-containing protein [Blautia sp.]|nr:DUF1667 domain-containing protein [Blautia sp.]